MQLEAQMSGASLVRYSPQKPAELSREMCLLYVDVSYIDITVAQYWQSGDKMYVDLNDAVGCYCFWRSTAYLWCEWGTALYLL